MKLRELAEIYQLAVYPFKKDEDLASYEKE